MTFQPLLTSPGNPPAAVTIVVSGFDDLLINPTTCAYVGIGEFVGACNSSTNLFHFENSSFVVLSQEFSNLKSFNPIKISSIQAFASPTIGVDKCLVASHLEVFIFRNFVERLKFVHEPVVKSCNLVPIAITKSAFFAA